MLLVLDERTVDEDVVDPTLPELIDEDREVIDELGAPDPIPVRGNTTPNKTA